MTAARTLAHEPDLVDRIFELLARDAPQVLVPYTAKQLEQIKAQARHEYAGEVCYIPVRSPNDRQRELHTILSTFNGRNATEIARKLEISRATVYRKLKQAPLSPAANDSKAFAGHKKPSQVS